MLFKSLFLSLAFLGVVCGESTSMRGAAVESGIQADSVVGTESAIGVQTATYTGYCTADCITTPYFGTAVACPSTLSVTCPAVDVTTKPGSGCSGTLKNTAGSACTYYGYPSSSTCPSYYTVPSYTLSCASGYYAYCNYESKSLSVQVSGTVTC